MWFHWKYTDFSRRPLVNYELITLKNYSSILLDSQMAFQRSFFFFFCCPCPTDKWFLQTVINVTICITINTIKAIISVWFRLPGRNKDRGKGNANSVYVEPCLRNQCLFMTLEILKDICSNPIKVVLACMRLHNGPSMQL